jgi:hypothetical protein
MKRSRGARVRKRHRRVRWRRPARRQAPPWERSPLRSSSTSMLRLLQALLDLLLRDPGGGYPSDAKRFPHTNLHLRSWATTQGMALDRLNLPQKVECGKTRHPYTTRKAGYRPSRRSSDASRIRARRGPTIPSFQVAQHSHSIGISHFPARGEHHIPVPCTNESATISIHQHSLWTTSELAVE